MNNNISVFFAIDDNYAPFLLITLNSIIKNMSKNNNYNIYVLNNGLSEQSTSKIKNYECENLKISFVNMSKIMKSFGEILHTRDYYSKATYYRLFIPTMFPNLNKALYLDCDIVVNSDIADLYNTNLGNNLVGAVLDEAVGLIPEFQNYVKNFLDVPHSKYFNAGVLLMNLEQMRKFNFEQKFINLLASYKFDVAQDQDYLNVICKNRVTYLPKSWNKMPFKDSICEKDINLIHYNLSYKPWHYDNIEYQKYFWEYATSAGLLEQMKQTLSAYSDSQKQADSASGARLIKMAQKQSEMQDTFASLLKSGEINSTTFVRQELFDASALLTQSKQALKEQIDGNEDSIWQLANMD